MVQVLGFSLQLSVVLSAVAALVLVSEMLFTGLMMSKQMRMKNHSSLLRRMEWAEYQLKDTVVNQLFQLLLQLKDTRVDTLTSSQNIITDN